MIVVSSLLKTILLDIQNQLIAHPLGIKIIWPSIHSYVHTQNNSTFDGSGMANFSSIAKLKSPSLRRYNGSTFGY